MRITLISLYVLVHTRYDYLKKGISNGRSERSLKEYVDLYNHFQSQFQPYSSAKNLPNMDLIFLELTVGDQSEMAIFFFFSIG